MPEQDALASRSWLANEWALQVTHVMESMTGEAPAVVYAPRELSAAEIDAHQTELIWWEQRFSSGPDAIAWIGAAAKSWEEIGSRVLKSAGVDDGDQETIRSTYLEIISQALSGVPEPYPSERAGKLRVWRAGLLRPNRWPIRRPMHSKSPSANRPFRFWRCLASRSKISRKQDRRPAS